MMNKRFEKISKICRYMAYAVAFYVIVSLVLQMGLFALCNWLISTEKPEGGLFIRQIMMLDPIVVRVFMTIVVISIIIDAGHIFQIFLIDIPAGMIAMFLVRWVQQTWSFNVPEPWRVFTSEEFIAFLVTVLVGCLFNVEVTRIYRHSN